MPQKLPFVLLLLLAAASASFAGAMPVVVSIPPQKWLAEQVGGPLVSVRVLLDKTRDPHSFEPAPEQIAALFRARLCFAAGLEFERELLGKLKESGSQVQVVDTAAGIARISMAAPEHPEQGHDHGHGGLDPHVWLDPRNAQEMAAVMTKALAEADPANAAAYRRNFAALAAALAALHQEIKAQLAPFSGQAFLVYHPAFGYFAQAYGLRQEAVETGGKPPSSKQLYALIGRMRQERARTIFVQPQFDRRNAETVAQAIGASVEAIDDLAEDVPANLRRMAGQITAALNKK